MQTPQERLEAARRVAVTVAREDINVFATLILRDERTGRPIKLAPLHREISTFLDAHPRAVLWGYVESGKTEIAVVTRILHALGRDPTLRVGLVANTARQAEKILRKISHMIQKNPTLREVFPRLKPASPWRENAITVERPTTARDPSVQALGVHGNVLGSRLDMVVMDDVVDFENSRSTGGRVDLRDWVLSTLFGRLTANARVIVNGNAFHPEDVMHYLEALPGWAGRRFPVLDPQGNSTWPERWPLERIEDKRLEVGPLEFARQMLCQPRSEDDARFKKADIDACLAAGAQIPSFMAAGVDAWRPELGQVYKQRCRFYTGVDLAVQTHAHADKSAIFTLCVHPDQKREPVSVETGRWTAMEILDRIAVAWQRWRSVIVVENVSAQNWMLQLAQSLKGVPTKAFTTGSGKASLEFQAETLAAEVGSRLWVIPSYPALHPVVAEWVGAMLYYSPAGHTHDTLAASLFARWAAAQGDPVPQAQGKAQLVGARGGGCWG